MNSNTAIPITENRIKTSKSIPWLRLSIHILGLLPLAELLYKYLINQLTVNPIQYIEQFFGRAALNLLVVTLAVTPIVTITGLKKLSKHRRALGLYTFLYFALHFTTFAVLDYGLNFRQIYLLTIQKPFILLGTLAGLMLIALASTSFKYWMKRLGKNWGELHKLVYLVGGFAVFHYALAVKGSLSTLSGNIIRPLIMGILVIVLMVVRIPPVKRAIIKLRNRIVESIQNMRHVPHGSID